MVVEPFGTKNMSVEENSKTQHPALIVDVI